MRLSKFFLHPAFVIAASVCSIVSVPLAFFFYLQTVIRPGITYAVHPVRAVLATPGDVSELSVSYGGNPIAGAVSAVQVAIWNRGRKPVTPQQILERTILKIEDGSGILECTPRSVSREVVRPRVTVRDESSIWIDWDILEQDDGFVLQVIYSGNIDAVVAVSGIWQGQRSLNRSEIPGEVKSEKASFEASRAETRRVAWLLVGMAVFMSIVAITSLVIVPRQERRRGQRLEEFAESAGLDEDERSLLLARSVSGFLDGADRIFLTASVLFGIAALVGACYLFFFKVSGGPPFGFE